MLNLGRRFMGQGAYAFLWVVVLFGFSGDLLAVGGQLSCTFLLTQNPTSVVSLVWRNRLSERGLLSDKVLQALLIFDAEQLCGESGKAAKRLAAARFYAGLTERRLVGDDLKLFRDLGQLGQVGARTLKQWSSLRQSGFRFATFDAPVVGPVTHIGYVEPGSRTLFLRPDPEGRDPLHPTIFGALAVSDAFFVNRTVSNFVGERPKLLDYELKFRRFVLGKLLGAHQALAQHFKPKNSGALVGSPWDEDAVGQVWTYFRRLLGWRQALALHRIAVAYKLPAENLPFRQLEIAIKAAGEAKGVSIERELLQALVFAPGDLHPGLDVLFDAKLPETWWKP